MGESSDSETGTPENSELGRKEYWDAAYKEELENLHQLGQEGELW